MSMNLYYVNICLVTFETNCNKNLTKWSCAIWNMFHILMQVITQVWRLMSKLLNFCFWLMHITNRNPSDKNESNKSFQFWIVKVSSWKFTSKAFQKNNSRLKMSRACSLNPNMIPNCKLLKIVSDWWSYPEIQVTKAKYHRWNKFPG